MRHALLLGALILSATLTEAQERRFVLRPASARSSHEFTRIGSVRELADGRLLVTDVGDDELLIVDLATGEARPVAAKGAGPGEFRDPGKLIALAGDSTIMADRSNRRALLLHHDRVVATLAPDDPLVTALGTDLIGADARGRVIGLRGLPPATHAATPRRDRVAVTVLDRRTMALDTIAIMRAVELHTQTVGSPPHQGFRTSTAIMSSPEQAEVFPDGEVAVALQDPYRVEWHSSDGQVRRSAAIERAPPPIDDAEKLAWKRRQEEWSGRPLNLDLTLFQWAATVPPFRQEGLTALPDGRLLVAREPWRGNAGNVHDIIDRRGDRVGTLQLPASERIVGTGRGVVFVAAADGDGVERLQRHPWP